LVKLPRLWLFSLENAEPHGVIYTIRRFVTNDNIINYVQLSTNYQYSGNINSIVKWDGSWQTGDSRNTYLLIDFKDRFIFPNHYSMKRCKIHCFALEWALYGLNSLDESPVEISRNASIGSTYCGNPSTCGGGCCNNDWGTFMINFPTRAFRYLKMTILTPSCSGWYMATSSFEVFGILYKDGLTSLTRKAFCLKSCSNNFHLPVYAFILLFSIHIS
jgi:hypothetical protein